MEELDRIENHGYAEVRGRRKETVNAVKRASEGVEHIVGETVKVSSRWSPRE